MNKKRSESARLKGQLYSQAIFEEKKGINNNEKVDKLIEKSVKIEISSGSKTKNTKEYERKEIE